MVLQALFTGFQLTNFSVFFATIPLPCLAPDLHRQSKVTPVGNCAPNFKPWHQIVENGQYHSATTLPKSVD